MSRGRVLSSVGVADVAAVVATAALVITGDDEPKVAGQALEHIGMVTGTVWVANEDGASIPVGAKPNGVSFSPVTVSDRRATKLELPMTKGVAVK